MEKFPGRRCSRCLINWPNHRAYMHCPKCKMITSVVSVGEVMGHAEAKREVSYIMFDEWLSQETDEERELRRSKSEERRIMMEEEERKREKTIAEIKRRFHSVLRGGGFTKDERETYAHYENRLPMAHVRPHPDLSD